ncbi:uncharacterized protein LOC126701217 [Quercus robur]|uniref:uncharacterized protein LOC126701217 n=1 Tax=Quercus robur TaxID=38942 RepID=UPI0021638B66|nr:uncharacterized protein LOC126701217 [Quercus robur]
MSIDKAWMFMKDRGSQEWQNGMKAFLDMAFAEVAEANTIRCPCRKCVNVVPKTRNEVALDLCKFGMDQNYKIWIHHGEEWYDEPSNENSGGIDNESNQERSDDARAYEMINNMMRAENLASTTIGGDDDLHMRDSEEPNDNAKKFLLLLQDAGQKLYPGCKNLTKLSFVMRLFQMKCLYGWSNKSVEGLLEFLRFSYPDGNLVPESFYNAKKMIRDLGLDYEKIDACIDDCVLYRNEYADLEKCPRCKKSRWKSNESNGNIIGKKKNHKKVPQKILRYFPLTPRLQRLFLTKNIASEMRWHKEGRVDDGVLRHPADSMAWKQLDEVHSWFALDSRNVRLGLASDGFNPYGVMSSSHSTWPVMLIPYNLPPWMCLKQPFWIMSMIIPGPTSPGNNIDIYLQPLIDELNQLWENGVETYDVSLGQNFRLHAAILWTINDFPAYAVMSGWSTKGGLACPCCHKDTVSLRLKHGRKHCYMGHRRFLEANHKWRRNKEAFDNTRETREAPKPLSGDDVIEQYKTFEQVIFGKTTGKRKRDQKIKCYNWRKKSIFFDLPYWKTLLLRHNLDVMHIEKNICDSILGTLLEIKGKTKDGPNARHDLKVMGIRKDLHPKRKELTVEALDQIDHQIAETLCRLEQVFPPSFFDVMMHLPIHLAYEAKVAGPVQYRWMYPIERYLRTLKGYVRNKAHPEGSIAEGQNCMFEALCNSELQMAHHYILTNCEEVSPWVDEHIRELTSINPRNVEQRHKEQFSKWFKSQIEQLYDNQDERINEQILSLARGPDSCARVYSQYTINGFLFRTKESEQMLKTQNSGVVVKGDESTGYIDWFGVIKKIITLDYLGSNEVILFKCDWFEVPPQGRHQSRGYKKDVYGFINVDTTCLHYKDDPFILGIQAEQVCYAKDVENPNWCSVIKLRPRNLFAMPNREQEVDDENDNSNFEPYELNEVLRSQHDMGGSEEGSEDMTSWCRSDMEGLGIEVSVDENIHLEDDLLSDNNETDIEEDDNV